MVVAGVEESSGRLVRGGSETDGTRSVEVTRQGVRVFDDCDNSYYIMLKTKQPVLKMKNAPLSRKPSLPIRRTSSAQSNLSAQSCLSDRLVYHKFSHDFHT